MPNFVYYIIIFFFLFLSIVFSSADMAYSIIDKKAFKSHAELTKKRSSWVAYKLALDYDLTITSILFGNNLANIGAASFVTILATRYDANKGPVLATIILTVFIIIFCEFLPKAITKRYPIKLATVYAFPLRIFEIISFIFVWPISKMFKLIGKPLEKFAEEEDEIDDDVLQEMVDYGEDEGVFEEGEAELVRSAIDLTNTEVYQIMTPRVNTTFINIDDKVSDIMKDEEVFKHSRIPVFRRTPDNIVGILPIKSLLKANLINPKKINIAKLSYEPIYIPRNTMVLDLLEEMKKNKIHIAIVVDEFGGTDGIVTMEDILETIVGDIFDEKDVIKHDVVEKPDHTLIVDGEMNLMEFFELIDYQDDFETSYETVGGFCLEFTDGFAKKGDCFDFGGYHFQILKVDEFTVEKVKVSKINDEEEDS